MAKTKEEGESAGAFYPTSVVAIDSLRPWPTNYLIHGQDQLEALGSSLATFGQAKNIVTWRGYIVAGHGLVEAAKQLGWTHIEVKELNPDLTEIQVEAYLIADNRTAELSTKNESLLADMLHRIRSNGGDGLLPAVGYNTDEIDRKLRALSQMSFVNSMEATVQQAYQQAISTVNHSPLPAPGQPAPGQPAPGIFPMPINPDGSPVMIAQPSTAPAQPSVAYVQLQFPLIAEQRDRVLTVLKHIQEANGLNNSIHALVHLCESYAAQVGL